MSIKTPVAKIKTLRASRKHKAMIEASQAKLAETTLVPGCVTIYA